MQLESLYQEIILDHYRRPHHKGLRDPYDAEVRHVNPTCGDCSISQASVSVLSDLIIGKPVSDALATCGEFVTLMQSRGEAQPDEDVLGDAIAFAGVSKYPARIKCALLGWMAWKDATAQAMKDDEPS
jgi:nitrogen fixation NifU-like protein